MVMVLLVVLVSVSPAATATVAVFDSAAGTDAATATLMVKVLVEWAPTVPASHVTLWPLAVHEAPDALTKVTPAGSVSVTVAVVSDGPAFAMAIV
jgi:hypothetical protein